MKKEEEPPLWRSISSDPQDCQCVTWSTPDTVQAITTHNHPHWKMLRGTPNRICKGATSGDLHSHRSVNPDRLQPHRLLQQTPTIVNYGPKPRSTIKEVNSRQETAQKCSSEQQSKKVHRSNQFWALHLASPGRIRPHQNFEMALLNTSNRPKPRFFAEEALCHQKITQKTDAGVVQHQQVANFSNFVRLNTAIEGHSTDHNQSLSSSATNTSQVR